MPLTLRKIHDHLDGCQNAELKGRDAIHRYAPYHYEGIGYLLAKTCQNVGNQKTSKLRAYELEGREHGVLAQFRLGRLFYQKRLQVSTSRNDFTQYSTLEEPDQIFAWMAFNENKDIPARVF